MVRIFVLLSVSAVLHAACAAIPRVDSRAVGLSQTGDVVRISYTLTGAPAVVTVDVQTNTQTDASGSWVSVGGKGMGVLGGEANKLVRVLDKQVSAYWFPLHVCSDGSLDLSNVRAVVTSWPTNTPPDYMVVNLTGPTNDAVRFYASTNALPGGFGDPAYKTTKLVMRKIPAKDVVWRMGSPEGESGRNDADIAHRVMLTEDYYLAVYEHTQGQYTSLGLSNPSLRTGYADSPMRPAERCGNTMLRGNPWGEVTPSSLFGRLRAQSGIADMDLPTEAQWEYASRSGNGGQYCCSNTGQVLDNFAWFNDNSYDDVLGGNGPHVVGTRRPNSWGVYDMHGNVMEIVRDRGSIGDFTDQYKATFADGWESGAITVDPLGVTDTSVTRANIRGGSYSDINWDCRSGRRRQGTLDYDVGSSVGYIGFRASCSVREAVK